MRDLRGKTALLTGASSGLGPHIARALRAEGLDLVLSARSQAPLETLAAEVGGRVILADINQRVDIERLAAEVGEVDVLVSNAGIPGSGPLTDFSLDEIDNALRVNLRTGIMLARLLLPAMLKRKSGHLVFMASLAGVVPGPKTSIYNATKFGLRGFALALRMELHGTGVGVSLVSPTYVSDAGMWADTGLKASTKEVSPGEVARAVVKSIREDRREIVVASPSVVAGSKMAALLPGVAERVARRAAAHPDVAVDKQRSKR